MAEDSELWDVICDGLFVPTKTSSDPTVTIPKTRKEFNDADRKAIEKNFHAKKILVCGIGPDEYNRISVCQSAKEIWEALQTAHEGTTQAKDLQKLTIDELVGNLKRYEMKKKKDNERREPKREKNLVLKTDNNHSSGEDGDMAYLTRRFQKWFAEMEQDQFKHNTDKAAKRNPVPDKCFKRKNAADNVVKQALAVWGDCSSESEEDNDHGDSSMMEVENAYHSVLNDKNALIVELGEAKQSGDDLVAVVVDLKETIESLKKEKDVLTKRVANTELERDDLLAVVVDLNNTIKELKGGGRHETLHKGKEVANETHIRLEDEMKTVKSRLCIELEKNKQLQEELGRVKRSNEGEQPTMALQGGSVSFENGKKRYILGVGRIGKSLSHSIENVYYVNGLKYNLLSVSQICYKGNKVEFVSKICTVTNLVTSEVVLVAKRYKNIYVADFESQQSGDLSCLRAVDDDAELWHRRLGHASFSLLNKLVQKDLVHGLPKSSFKEHKLVSDLTMGHNFIMPSSMNSVSKITHNFSAPRTPQQNGVVDRKNMTLEDMASIMLIESGIVKCFWAETVNTACYLINRCMIRSLLNKIPYELLNGRKPKLTHLRTFGCKCFVLNNGEEALGKFDSKSDEGIFLGYSSQSKAYKVYNRRTQCVEESIHVIFDESYFSCEKDRHDDQDGEPLSVPSEVIEMTNRKVDMMSHVNESSEDDATTSPSIGEEPSLTIITTEAENRVVDAVQGTPLAEIRSGQEPQSDILGYSTNKAQVPNWKHKSSHLLDNIIIPLDSGIQTRSKARNSLAFSAFLFQIEPKHIKEALKDAE
ncbi:uncharacterized protein LOC142175391 [Nicotiana tabacum]|uniref:Uncharacterized protein LOC142175391 n=1 Tax=Nicotiana tabacum TaxID=4097 RepID=A0AC58TLI3_TOBAC